VLALLLACVASLGDRTPDRVVLKDGAKLEGCVILEDATRIVVRVGSRDRVVSRKDVKSAVTRLSAWQEAMDRWWLLEKEDPRKIADMAVFARRTGLAEEARTFALLAIANDPENDIAREVLGHQRTEKGWSVREGARSTSWEEVEKRSVDFEHAWELETTHWKLRTNMPLYRSAATIIDLENVYNAFMTLIAPEVGAFHLCQPLEARIRAEKGARAALGAQRGYDREARLLQLDAEDQLDRGMMVHEALQMVLVATSSLAPGAKGEIPPWLEEGLAGYFRVTLEGLPGRLKYDVDAIDGAAMRVQARAEKTYALARVVSFDASDFQSTSSEDLKYVQAYTLVHYFLNADGGQWRSRFFDYARGAWNGKGSASDLEHAIGQDLDAIDKAWNAWVQERAK
jgi:hypothetical protein